MKQNYLPSGGNLSEITAIAKKRIAIMALVNIVIVAVTQFVFQVNYSRQIGNRPSAYLWLIVVFFLIYIGILPYLARIAYTLNAFGTLAIVLLSIVIFLKNGDVSILRKNIPYYLLAAVKIPSTFLLYKDSYIAYFLRYKHLKMK